MARSNPNLHDGPISDSAACLIVFAGTIAVSGVIAALAYLILISTYR